jgi:hypothetical protein
MSGASKKTRTGTGSAGTSDIAVRLHAQPSRQRDDDTVDDLLGIVGHDLTLPRASCIY